MEYGPYISGNIPGGFHKELVIEEINDDLEITMYRPAPGNSGSIP